MRSLSNPLQVLLLASILVSGCDPSIIIGVVHEDVLLPCVVTYNELFAYDKLSVLWNKENYGVHHFYYGKEQAEHQDIVFRGRTRLFPEEFPKGNLSLLLKNVQASDAGIYECRVFLHRLTEYKTRRTELVLQDKLKGPDKPINESSARTLSVSVAVICLIAVLIVVLRRRKRSRGAEGMALCDQSPETKKKL
ncbi:hypothetical protein FKM82_017253 [Ascaphus truei]